MAAGRADRVGDPGQEDTAGAQPPQDVVEGAGHLCLVEVLEQIGGHDGVPRAGGGGQQVVEVAELDLGRAGPLGQAHLFLADVDAVGVEPVGVQEPHQLALAAAEVEHPATRGGTGQSRPEVATVDESRGDRVAAASVGGGVGLVVAIGDRGPGREAIHAHPPRPGSPSGAGWRTGRVANGNSWPG